MHPLSFHRGLQKAFKLSSMLMPEKELLKPLRGVSKRSFRASYYLNYSVLGFTLVKGCYEDLSDL